MAPALWLVSYSYCYSDVVTGVTNNAARNGLEWDMSNVLPKQAGLTVGGLTYKYSVTKEVQDDFKVHVENDDKIRGGVIFRETDDWSKLPGNTIFKAVPLDDVVIDRFGNGRIRPEGDSTVTDPTVRYFYRYDECYDPLSSPECPGYAAAFRQFLLDSGLLNQEISDPLEDENVKNALDNETELKEEKKEEEEEKEEEEDDKKKSLEKRLALKDEVNKIADSTAQNAMMQALAQVERIESYIAKEIKGGTYPETIKLQDKKINDNRSASLTLGLQSDKAHQQLVDLQYKGK